MSVFLSTVLFSVCGSLIQRRESIFFGSPPKTKWASEARFAWCRSIFGPQNGRVRPALSRCLAEVVGFLVLSMGFVGPGRVAQIPCLGPAVVRVLFGRPPWRRSLPLALRNTFFFIACSARDRVSSLWFLVEGPPMVCVFASSPMFRVFGLGRKGLMAIPG